MPARNYADLIAWQKAMDLVEETYRVSARFPKEEVYGLTSQLRRSAVSIPSSIAEGQGRRTKQEFAHYLSIAYGSLREAETQFLIAERLEFLDHETCERLMTAAGEVGRLINGLRAGIEQHRGS